MRLDRRAFTGGLVAALAARRGAPKNVLTSDNLSALYGARVQRLTDAAGGQAFLPE